MNHFSLFRGSLSRGLRVGLAIAQVVAALGAAAVGTLQPPGLEPLVGAPREADAHYLQMSITFASPDPEVQSMFQARVARGESVIQVGDIITVVFGGLSFIGTQDGFGGYFDFYPLTGTQIVNAEYVRPVPGGYAMAPVKKSPAFGTVLATTDPTGLLKLFTVGPNIHGVTSKPASSASANLGTIYGFYGDTGIFYATDPRTAFGSWGNVSGNIVNNQGSVVNDVPVTRYDIEQLRALGMAAPRACIFDSICRGDPPWGLGSPVAGPESGYPWQFRITDTLAVGVPAFSLETGPFRRIAYPGSQISNDTPGNLSGALFDTSLDASTVGWPLSPANPLPPTTSWSDQTSPKLIRFAVGRLTFGQPEYARVAMKIVDASAMPNVNGCPLFSAMAFSGDAGVLGGGKDHIWRYFNPTIASYNACLSVFKSPARPAVSLNDIFTYSLSAYNMGALTLTNVTVSDTLPAGLTFVSAVPPASGTNPHTWNIGQLGPNSRWSAVVAVRAAAAGVLPNVMVVNSSAGSVNTQALVAVATPILYESKTVAPAAVAPGGTVTYTIALENRGTADSLTPVRVYETLPAAFTFTGLKSVVVNGADVTSGSTAVGTRPLTLSMPSTLAIQPGRQAILVFTARAGSAITAGSYCNTFDVVYGAAVSTVANTACVTVASASIGDTVWRDWNGDGVQGPDEAGSPGLVVTLTPASGVVITTTTDASGKYLFNGLVAGTYTVTVGTPSGWTVTGDPQGALDGGATYVLSASTVVTVADFGLQPGGAGVIGDQVFNDVGNDGVFDAGTDTNIPNVTVWLYADANGNGALDAGEPPILTSTTDAAGLYTFTHLAIGLDYVVGVDRLDADLTTYYSPQAYVASTPTQVAVAALSSTPVVTADFGFWALVPASIGDRVCDDANLDGLCGTGETGIPGVVVTLYRDVNQDGIGDTLVATATTSITGSYLFANLGPGSYLVSIDPADPAFPAYLGSDMTSMSVVLAAGEDVRTADFPAHPQLFKQVSRAHAGYSDTLIYTLSVAYSGDADARSLVVNDPLPAGTTFVTASAGATFGPYVSTAAAPGFDDQSANVPAFTAGLTLTVSPTTTRTGGVVTVTLRITSTIAISNVSPALTANGPGAVCGSPLPGSSADPVTVTNASPATYVYTCTLTEDGEYTFDGGAEGSLGADPYAWPGATSCSVLVSPDGSTSVVQWALGSTAAALDAVTLGGGTVPLIYAFEGGNKAFDQYSVLTNTWSAAPPADPTGFPANVGAGGALAWNGVMGDSAIVYALAGNNTKAFWAYAPATNAWAKKLDLLGAAKAGAGLAVIGDVVYALRGNGRPDFYTYTISTNVWKAAANFGQNVNAGGALASDGTVVYSTQGGGQKRFFRYTPISNTWQARSDLPVNVGSGGALVYLSPYVYALTGNTTRNVYRYDPAANTWTALAGVPSVVKDGGALATDGSDLYAFAGNATTTFYRYNPALNAWSSLASSLALVKAGGALAYAGGTATVDRSMALATLPRVAGSGEHLSVTMQLYSGSSVTNVVPGPLIVSDTAASGASATCAGPLPPSANVLSGTMATFAWDCAVTAGNRPGSLTFKAAATGTLPVTTTWVAATSNGLIVVPTLTMTLRVLSPTTVSTVKNTATLLDASGAIGPAPSNRVQTAIAATLGDTVWADLNGNGLQDPGEPGIPGVVVSLTQPGGSTITLITDLNGQYAFGNLSPGPYTVTYDLATAPAGFVPTTQTHITVALAANQVYTLADFGLRPPDIARIGDTVWHDANDDGIFDPLTEPPLPGIGVDLYADANGNGVLDASDPLIATTWTSVTGTYQFSSLPPFTYFVGVNPSSVVTSAYGDQSNGVTATLGAAMTPTLGTPLTRTVVVAAGQAITTADFGFTWGASIGDYVWYDTNANGIQNDAGDEGGAPLGVIELVYDTNHDGVYQPGEPLIIVTQTPASGLYLAAHLPPGHYIVEAEGQAIPAPASTGVLSGAVGVMMATTPDEIYVSLAGNQAYRAADFGWAAGALVEGSVFHDVNGSGSRDLYETAGFAGVGVTLTGSDGRVLTTTTASDGSFRFPPVVAGTYTVTYDTAASELAGYPKRTGPVVQTFNLDYGQTRVIDFGVTNAGTIGDTVFYDANNNGLPDPGEIGLSGATVLLYQSGVFFAAQSTGPTGTYAFVGLPAGTYSVTVITATVPAIYPLNTRAVLTTVTLAANGAITTADFGFRADAATFTLTGRVVSDTTGTIGIVDPSDPGLRGGLQVVVVFTPTGGVPIWVTAAVDATGAYTVPGIPSGADALIYPVPSTIPAGYVTTTADTRGVTNITANVTDQSFGYAFSPAGIGGTVVDGAPDGNGIAEPPTETVMSGVTITLQYAGADGLFGTPDDGLFTTTTDIQGTYLFTGLLPGLYAVSDVYPPGYTGLADRDGGDPGSIGPIALTTGGRVETRDFELQQEPVDLVLVKTASANPILPGSRLTYTLVITNLGPGAALNTVVSDTLPVSTTVATASPVPATVSPLAWSLGTLASGQAATITLVVTVSAWAQGSLTNTAGVSTTSPETMTVNNVDPEVTDLIWLGTVTGTIFMDRNGNGVLDPGEGLPGVSVRVTPANGGVVTTSTDANGVYSATQLGPGPAVVDVDATTLPPGSNQTVGTDPTTTAVTASVTANAGLDGYRQLGTVYGFVYADTLGNGVFDAGDTPAMGVSVLITDSQGLTQTVLTNSAGYFVATHVTSGTVTIDLMNPPAGSQTEGTDPTTATVTANQNTFEESHGFYAPPTAIQLTRFSVASTAAGLAVGWTVASEDNTLAYHLYRATQADRSEAIRVTPAAIAATGAGDYVWVDATAAGQVTYFYWLAEMDTGGAVTEYGPAAGRIGPRLFLPGISR